jgi:protein-S-isoprenylcysteine O-methyltransferase Ste14
MDPWFGKAAVLAATVALVAVRAPHGHRSRTVKVARSRKGPLEAALLAFAWIGFFVPLLWVATPLLSFADYPLLPVPWAAGLALLAGGLLLFHRSHADLGTNWSITLEVREGHRLVTGGVYRRIRHPMYLALLLYSAGMALVLPNGIAGPSYGAAFGVLLAFRLGPEERMLREEFGAEFDAWAARTRRLLPGVW